MYRTRSQSHRQTDMPIYFIDCSLIVYQYFVKLISGQFISVREYLLPNLDYVLSLCMNFEYKMKSFSLHVVSLKLKFTRIFRCCRLTHCF